MKIPLYKPYLPERAIRFMDDSFSSGWLGYGCKSKTLEKKFVDKYSGWSIATNSCTSAIYIAASVLNLSKQDEIIVPGITYISTAMPFINVGAKVVVADVDPNTLMLDFNNITSYINENTKAIVVVHLYGQKYDVLKLRKLCDELNIMLIEDRAHRIGFDDDKLVGDICCFSFNVMKELPSGEGGLIWSKRHELMERARQIANVGLLNDTYKRCAKAKHINYQFSENIGLKLLQNDIIASLTLGLFEYYFSNIEKRRNIVMQYDEAFSKISWIRLIPKKDNSSYLMYVIVVDRDMIEILRDYLSINNIATNQHYVSLSRHPLIKENDPLDVAEEYDQRIVTLPCYVEMTKENIDKVIKAIVYIDNKRKEYIEKFKINNSFKISCNNFFVRKISDKNIDYCAKARKTNGKYFFRKTDCLDDSKKWIYEHRNSFDDCLLEICKLDDGLFIGTIGLKYNYVTNIAEIGRMVLYIPHVKGLKKCEISGIGEQVCVELIQFAFEKLKAKKVISIVKKNNSYSNALNKYVKGNKEKIIYHIDNNESLECYQYEITPETFKRASCL